MFEKKEEKENPEKQQTSIFGRYQYSTKISKEDETDGSNDRQSQHRPLLARAGVPVGSALLAYGSMGQTTTISNFGGINAVAGGISGIGGIGGNSGNSSISGVSKSPKKVTSTTVLIEDEEKKINSDKPKSTICNIGMRRSNITRYIAVKLYNSSLRAKLRISGILSWTTVLVITILILILNIDNITFDILKVTSVSREQVCILNF